MYSLCKQRGEGEIEKALPQCRFGELRDVMGVSKLHGEGIRGEENDACNQPFLVRQKALDQSQSDPLFFCGFSFFVRGTRSELHGALSLVGNLS
jgi:hypothetical protein